MKMSGLIEQLTVHVQQTDCNENNVQRAAQESAAAEEVRPVIRANIPKMPVNLALKSYKAAAAGLERRPMSLKLASRKGCTNTGAIQTA